MGKEQEGRGSSFFPPQGYPGSTVYSEGPLGEGCGAGGPGKIGNSW